MGKTGLTQTQSKKIEPRNGTQSTMASYVVYK